MGLQRATKNGLARLDPGSNLGTRFRDASDQEFPGNKSQALIDVIPTEVLGLYTTIIAVIVANAADGTWESGRWIVYGVLAGLVPITILVISNRAARAQTKRTAVPVYEMIGATAAFGAWGLIMPGGPLTYSLSTVDLTIWTVIITSGTTFILFLLPLNRPVG